jgi:hypothetical protein
MRALLLAVAVAILVISAYTFISRATLQRGSIFPQVVSCVNQNSPQSAPDPHWPPTLRVKVEPVRDPGRVREYRVLGCTLYYYHAHFK